MNNSLVELALKKQRLQLRAAAQRRQMARVLESAAPALRLVDKLNAGLRWLRANPQWLVGIGITLLVARPRFLLRWARRGFFLWHSLRRLRLALERILALR